MKHKNFLTTATEKETLDSGDGNEAESPGQKMLNEMMQYLKNISSKPVWTNPPEKVKNEPDQSLPVR